MVAVTASAMPGDRERMLVAGFDGYIPKPFVPEKFVSQIEEFLPAGLRAGQEKPQERAKPASDSKSRYLREMADAFVEKLPEQLAGLHADLNREDFKSLRVAAHKMLGTCVFLKEPELIDALRKLEATIDGKQNDKIVPMLNEVERLAHVAESRLRPTHA
jgi:CheY-like chemotaxis protein